MVDLKKILRKAFDKDSLENEDWLEPSATLLEEIEGRIYTKKKGRGWLFLVPTLLVLLTVGVVCLGTNKIDGHSANPIKSQIAEKQSTENLINTEINNISTNLAVNETLTLNETENKTSIISVKNNLPIKLNSSALQKRDLSSYLSSSLNNEVVAFSRISTQNKSITKTENILDDSVVKMHKNPLKENKEITVILEKSSQLTKITSLDLQKVSTNKVLPNKLPIEVILPKKSTWSLVAGASASFWQFKLNDAYQTALATADFQSSNGVGARTFIGLDKKLGRRFSVGAKLGYEKIYFNSGHNSALSYDRNAETDSNRSNTKTIRMATPLGFIDSDLTIHRDTDLAGSEVLIDIKNRHSIQSLDLQLNLDYQLPTIFGLRPMITVGTGVQYIRKLNNELAYFRPKQRGFSEGKGKIIADQTSLNRWSPTVSTGFNLERSLTKNLSIGFNGTYIFNLSNLQEVDAFSTKVNRFNGGIYLSRKF